MDLENILDVAEKVRRENRREANDSTFGEADVRRREALVEKAQAIAAEWGASTEFQGDPRGWPLKLLWHREKGTEEVAVPVF